MDTQNEYFLNIFYVYFVHWFVLLGNVYRIIWIREILLFSQIYKTMTTKNVKSPSEIIAKHGKFQGTIEGLSWWSTR